MPKADYVNLKDFPQDTKGLYVFHTGHDLDCDSLAFKYGYSLDIVARLHGYHNSQIGGVHLVAILLAKTDFTDGDVHRMETAFKKFLTKNDGVDYLKTEARARKVAEWVTVKKQGNVNPWTVLQGYIDDFYETYKRKYFRESYYNSGTKSNEKPLVLFRFPLKKDRYSCKDQRN